MTKRSAPLWFTIFNAIPTEVPATEPRALLFHQRAFIADAVFERLTVVDDRRVVRSSE